MSSALAVMPELRGCQEPRISLVAPYESSAGEEAIGLAALAGLELDPWQQLVLRHSLGERNGRWAAFEVGLVVARQNGKDAILEAREIAGLFLFGERLIMHSAHKFDTAMEHLERLVNLIEGTPELSRRVRKVNRSHGQEGITLRDGARIRFRARTRGGGGRGYTGDCVIFNEAMDLPDEIVGSMMPTMSARSRRRPGPQIYYAGSAVDQETMANGLVLARIREAAIAGENVRLGYFEWSAEDDAKPTDLTARAQANPGMGYRITPEYIETEYGSPAMSARQFAVERLGQGDWPDTDAEAERVIGAQAWADCAEHDRSQRIVSVPTFAIDVNPDRTWGSIAVAGTRADGRPQVAIVDHHRGTDWMVARCAALRQRHRKAKFVVDKRGPAAVLIDKLVAAHIPLIEAGTEDYGRACGAFFDDVDETALRYPAPQPELDAAIASARTAPLGDAWKWSRRHSTSSDISPLVAVTLARWGATAKKPRTRVINPNDYLSAADPASA